MLETGTGLLQQFKQRTSVLLICNYVSQIAQRKENKHILLYIFLLVLAFASKTTLLLKKHMNTKPKKSGKASGKKILDKCIQGKKLTIWIFSGWFKDSLVSASEL